MSKEIRLATRVGQGTPPSIWNVLRLEYVGHEAGKLFTDAQHAHIVDQIKELARAKKPSHPDTLSVDQIENYHELRDKGGVLGKLNIRVFFGIDKKERAIVILGLLKKENDGATPPAIKIQMGRRWRKYLNGDFGKPKRPRSD